MSQSSTESQVFQVRTALGTLHGNRHGRADDRPPLLFLQGFAALPEIWAPVIARLRGGRECITVDWRFGGSAGRGRGTSRVRRVRVFPASRIPDLVPAGEGPWRRARHGHGVVDPVGIQAQVRLRIAGTSPTSCHRWAHALRTDPRIRHDAARRMSGSSRSQTLRAAAMFASFHQPVTVVWAAHDRLLPRELGERLAASFPNSRFRVAENSRTFVPADQPEQLAQFIAELLDRAS